MTSAEPSRGLQDKHSFVCKWKSWGCETKARSEQGWDLNHSARLQNRPSQNPPLQRKRFSPLPAPLSRGNFFWQVSVAQLMSLSYWSREWCQNWKHFSETIPQLTVTWALCVCPEGSGRFRHTGHTDANLSKKPSFFCDSQDTLLIPYLFYVTVK